ncbi:nuclear transport factor 2 family protein [Aquibium carbonis]|uniref:Nuclear transport factor 2 family protein n=1 Tax=Aquibium carbonis TaxID=2495581 RepID=A0A429Z1Z9_9HYPH|nr:nuclear transport factor 2 family protein [Aquibium carbonis]RST87698.1 nuclear transport factor 2 family protein [Aquibium carbonis]
MTVALALTRRWVSDYFNRHDAEAARRFCAADYTLKIGDVVLSGRDDVWLPAVDRQMRDYPGLTMTVHETLTGPGWAAVWFSEHGQRGQSSAVWSGVAIYREAGGILTGCIAQEDYMTRRRQLKGGEADLVDRPCAAPWDTAAQEPNRANEAAVAAWLEGRWPKDGAVPCDDEHLTGDPIAFDVETIETREMLSAGNRVAFSVRQHGVYRSGIEEEASASAFFDVNGLLTVENDRIVSGRVIRDRMGLAGRLRGLQ